MLDTSSRRGSSSRAEGQVAIAAWGGTTVSGGAFDFHGRYAVPERQNARTNAATGTHSIAGKYASDLTTCQLPRDYAGVPSFTLIRVRRLRRPGEDVGARLSVRAAEPFSIDGRNRGEGPVLTCAGNLPLSSTSCPTAG